MKQTATSLTVEVLLLVCLQVMKSTGFFRGLYTSQELDAKSIQVRVHVCPCLSVCGVCSDDNNAMVWFVYFPCVLELSRRTASYTFCGDWLVGYSHSVAVSMISGAVVCLRCYRSSLLQTVHV